MALQIEKEKVLISDSDCHSDKNYKGPLIEFVDFNNMAECALNQELVSEFHTDDNIDMVNTASHLEIELVTPTVDFATKSTPINDDVLPEMMGFRESLVLNNQYNASTNSTHSDQEILVSIDMNSDIKKSKFIFLY